MLFQLPSGAFVPTGYSFSELRLRIGRSGLAISRNFATCLRAIEHRDPDSQWSTVNLGLSPLVIPKTCFSNLRAPNTRCHVRYSTQSLWDLSRLALSRFSPCSLQCRNRRSAESRLYRISCHLSALKSTASFKSRNYNS
jgi:hypothetical protein